MSEIELDRDELLDRVADRVAGRVILADALYGVAEVARLLGFRRTKTVYDIPVNELPRVPTGPGGGNLMYLGADVLRYVHSRRRSEP